MGKHTQGGSPLVFGQQAQQLCREIHIQQEIPGGVGESSRCLRVGIGVGNVGLDVENGGAVHQVGAAHMKNGTILPGMLYPQKPDAGQPQIVGPEGRTGGENPHPGVASQPGRPDSGGPALTDRLGKLPDQPQVGKFFNPPQGIGIPVFRLEHHGGAQILHQSALPGDAELGGEITANPGDGLNGCLHGHSLLLRRQKVTAKISASSRLMAAPAEHSV